MWRGLALGPVLVGALVGGLYAHVCLAQESLLDAARGASRAAPMDPSLALRYGVALRRAGHDTEAAQELRRGAAVAGTAQNETVVMLRYELARTAIARRDFWGAMSACRSIGSLPASHACMAEAHLLWGRATEALPETALALANGNRSYEGKVSEGLSYELEVKDEAAEASFRQAIAWSPSQWEAHVWLGRLLVRTLRHDEGVASLRHAVELDPHGAEPAFELARVLPANAESAGLLERAVHEKTGYSQALLRLSEVDLELGRLKPAREAAEAAIKSSPNEPAAYVVSGRVSLAEGKPDDALKAGQKALSLLTNSARAKLLIADAYAAKGEIDLAIESYQAAYGLDPSDPTSMVRASVACHAAGRDTSARAFGERATHDFPQWGPGWVALGDALAAQGEIAPAKSAYETALKSTGPVDAGSVRNKLFTLR
jgi:tetratricopeptide (TPR) repeat protein